MGSGDTKTESYLRAAAEGTRADLPSDTCCNTKTQNLILGVANRIMDVEDEVEELKNNPDVVDIVDTYADLQAYDTQHLTENDIIRVLQDETHNNNSTYYRFTKNPDTWTFIGEISGGGGPTVVQTTGSSTTDVMSQNATTTMVYTNSTLEEVRIGKDAGASGGLSVAIGYKADAGQISSVAIGRNARTSRAGEMNIGTGSYNNGYNNTKYRVLGGVHDPVDAHDAATKGYVDSNVAPTMFYAPFDIYQSQAGNVSIYLDESLTQAATGGDFYDAMAKYGQVILCVPPSYVDSDYHKIVSVYVHQPYEKSVTAFDSYPPEVYFAVPESPGFVSAILGFNSADPDATAFSYTINTQ